MTLCIVNDADRAELTIDTPQPTDPPEPTPPGEDGDRMPRWVKGFILAAVAAAMVVVVALLVGSGGHGPSRHLPGSGNGTIEAPGGHTPPADRG